MPRICSTVFILVFALLARGQNVGIGVANPTKGKLEIAGALGNQTTVLTIGSDGAGISLQRNWPTIGFNQYRDASNVQRFIGNGHAGSIFLSSDDGSIVFSQFGTGTANGLITNATYPVYIGGDGVINVTKKLNLAAGAEITKESLGSSSNLLPYAYGYVVANGNKLRGTNNFASSLVSTGVYKLAFTESVGNACVLITAYGAFGTVASFMLASSTSLNVYLYSKSGGLINESFTFLVYR